jgi:hypothetical protein
MLEGSKVAAIEANGVDVNRRQEDGQHARQGSTASTMIARDEPDSTTQFPKVDMAHAASLRPSRLHGTRLMVMVNVVAGVAFILFGFDQVKFWSV